MALCLVLMALPATVSAQDYGTLVPPRRKPATIDGESPAAARRALQQFGRCAVKSQARVQAFLNARMDTRDYSITLHKLASVDCLSEGMLKIPPINMRAAVFEALYEKELSKTALVFPADLTTGFAEQYADERSEHIRQVVTLEQFGECVSKKDATGVRALLDARPNSDEEDKATIALMPTFRG